MGFFHRNLLFLKIYSSPNMALYIFISSWLGTICFCPGLSSGANPNEAQCILWEINFLFGSKGVKALYLYIWLSRCLWWKGIKSKELVESTWSGAGQPRCDSPHENRSRGCDFTLGRPLHSIWSVHVCRIGQENCRKRRAQTAQRESNEAWAAGAKRRTVVHLHRPPLETNERQRSLE